MGRFSRKFSTRLCALLASVGLFQGIRYRWQHEWVTVEWLQPPQGGPAQDTSYLQDYTLPPPKKREVQCRQKQWEELFEKLNRSNNDEEKQKSANAKSENNKLEEIHDDAESTLDIAILGGGALGLYCALDAASRGLKVALFEAKDIGYGASSNSHRILPSGHSSVQRAYRQRSLSHLKNALNYASELRTLQILAPDVLSQHDVLVPYTHRGNGIELLGVRWVAYLLHQIVGLRKVAPINFGGNSAGAGTILGFHNVKNFLFDPLSAGEKGTKAGQNHEGIQYQKKEDSSSGAPIILQPGELAPDVHLDGGLVNQEYFIDENKLCLHLCQAAKQNGAQIFTYAPVVDVVRSGGTGAGSQLQTITAIKVRDDVLSNQKESIMNVVSKSTTTQKTTKPSSSEATVTIPVRSVINCAGVWTDVVKEMSPQEEPAVGSYSTNTSFVVPNAYIRGIQKVIKKTKERREEQEELGESSWPLLKTGIIASGVASEGRSFFILPWKEEGYSLLGTAQGPVRDVREAISPVDTQMEGDMCSATAADKDFHLIRQALNSFGIFLSSKDSSSSSIMMGGENKQQANKNVIKNKQNSRSAAADDDGTTDVISSLEQQKAVCSAIVTITPLLTNPNRVSAVTGAIQNDYSVQDGGTGMVTALGGNWTLLRLTAKELVDTAFKRYKTTAYLRANAELLQSVMLAEGANVSGMASTSSFHTAGEEDKKKDRLRHLPPSNDPDVKILKPSMNPFTGMRRTEEICVTPPSCRTKQVGLLTTQQSLHRNNNTPPRRIGIPPPKNCSSSVENTTTDTDDVGVMMQKKLLLEKKSSDWGQPIIYPPWISNMATNSSSTYNASSVPTWADLLLMLRQHDYYQLHTLNDFLFRRTNLGLTFPKEIMMMSTTTTEKKSKKKTADDINVLEKMGDLFAEELGWDKKYRSEMVNAAKHKLKSVQLIR